MQREEFMQHLRIAAVGARRESASTPPRADSGRSMTNVLLSLVCLALPIYADVTFGQPPDPGSGNVFPFGFSYNAEYQEVYNSGGFSGPITITGLEVYNTQFNS